MRIGLIADAHIANHRRWGGPLVGGLNERGRQSVDVLARAVKCAEDFGCRALFILGDLFDSSRPSPPLVAATIEALRSMTVQVFVLLGNHDMQSPERLDHAAASMSYTSGINIVSKVDTVRYGDLNVVMIPYQSGLATEWLPTAMAVGCQDRRGTTIALSHLGIWDDSTPSFLKSARDAVGLGQVRFLCDAHKVKAFAAGNWHDEKHWPAKEPERVDVLIPGTICPHSFSDSFTQNTGSLWLYSPETSFTRAAVIPGPRFKTVDLEQFNRTKSVGDGFDYFIRLRVPRAQLADAVKARDEHLEGCKDDNVEIDVVDEATAVHEAATAAVIASEGDLVEAYSELADVQEPGTREGVQRRLADYRKAAG